MRRFRVPLIALATAAIVGSGLATFAMADQTEGTTPNGWKITPAGVPGAGTT